MAGARCSIGKGNERAHLFLLAAALTRSRVIRRADGPIQNSRAIALSAPAAMRWPTLSRCGIPTSRTAEVFRSRCSSRAKSRPARREPTGFAIETDSIRPHRYGSEVVGHSTLESFVRAVAPPMLRCLFCTGFADDHDHVRGCPARGDLRSRCARGFTQSVCAARSPHGRWRRAMTPTNEKPSASEIRQYIDQFANQIYVRVKPRDCGRLAGLTIEQPATVTRMKRCESHSGSSSAARYGDGC